MPLRRLFQQLATTGLMRTARATERRGELGKAYQVYCQVLVKRATRFSPVLGEIRSAADFNKALGDIIADYVKFTQSRPRDKECREALDSILRLADRPAVVENKLTVESAKPYSRETYRELWRLVFFEDEKVLPAAALSAADRAFDAGLSWISVGSILKNNHFDGVLYDDSRAVAVSIDVRGGDDVGCLLVPGNWHALVRVVPERADPKTQRWMAANDIKGRYTCTAFTIPEQPALVTCRARLEAIRGSGAWI